MYDCEGYNINVEGGGRDEVRLVDHGKPKGTVVADSSDNVYHIDLNNEPMINMNEGFFIRHEE